MPADQSYTLRYPLWFAFLCWMMAIIGCGAFVDRFCYQFLPVAVKNMDERLELLLTALAPIGLGFTLMSLESITVSERTITSSWIGRRKTLDRATTNVVKTAQNFFNIQNKTGLKIVVRRVMEHSGLLYSDIADLHE